MSARGKMLAATWIRASGAGVLQPVSKIGSTNAATADRVVMGRESVAGYGPHVNTLFAKYNLQRTMYEVRIAEDEVERMTRKQKADSSLRSE